MACLYVLRCAPLLSALPRVWLDWTDISPTSGLSDTGASLTSLYTSTNTLPVYQVAIDLSSVVFNIVVTGGLPVSVTAFCCSCVASHSTECLILHQQPQSSASTSGLSRHHLQSQALQQTRAGSQRLCASMPANPISIV